MRFCCNRCLTCDGDGGGSGREQDTRLPARSFRFLMNTLTNLSSWTLTVALYLLCPFSLSARSQSLRPKQQCSDVNSTTSSTHRRQAHRAAGARRAKGEACMLEHRRATWSEAYGVRTGLLTHLTLSSSLRVGLLRQVSSQHRSSSAVESPLLTRPLSQRAYL